MLKINFLKRRPNWISKFPDILEFMIQTIIVPNFVAIGKKLIEF